MFIVISAILCNLIRILVMVMAARLAYKKGTRLSHLALPFTEAWLKMLCYLLGGLMGIAVLDILLIPLRIGWPHDSLSGFLVPTTFYATLWWLGEDDRRKRWKKRASDAVKKLIARIEEAAKGLVPKPLPQPTPG